MDRSREAAARRLRIALDLARDGIALMRQNLARRYPADPPSAIEAKLAAWARDRPGAASGDCPGRVVTRGR